ASLARRIALRVVTAAAIAAMRLRCHGKTRRYATGIPTVQQRARRSPRSTYGRPFARIHWRSPAGEVVGRAGPSGVALTRAAATDRPKDVMPASSRSPSFATCLNRASALQRKRGASPRMSDAGSRPSPRATVKARSARADDEASASSLHHAGQTAAIAESASPSSRSSLLRSDARRGAVIVSTPSSAIALTRLRSGPLELRRAPPFHPRPGSPQKQRSLEEPHARE